MQKLYYHGPILTMTGAPASALLTQDGVIRAVGALDEVRAQADRPEEIDLDGRALLPAFLDPHSHFSAYASSFLQVALEDSADFDEIAARIKKFIADNRIPAGQWVTAKGYDHNALAEHAHPTRALLDAAAPQNPLIMQHASGHVGVLNSRALAALGLGGDTPDPDGGRYGREGGRLTGYLEESAYFTAVRSAPMPDPATLMGAYAKDQQGYAAHGITTVQEGMAVAQMTDLYRALLAQGLLRLDLVAYAALDSADALREAFPAAVRRYDGHFKLGGYKIFLDGSPQGRTAWMRTPYAGERDYRGYGTMKDGEVAAAVRRAAADNMQLLAHCNGDAAAQQYLDALRLAAAQTDVARLRPVMIHAQLLGRDQLAAVRELGVIPSFFVAHVYHWGDVHRKNFGEARAAAISPAASALRAGIRFTFHQDTPVIEPDMLETIWCAANRLTRSGFLLGADERISVYEALRAVTANAAYQYFEEDSKGVLAPGCRADLVLLDRDPLAVDPAQLRAVRVLETIKDGQTIWRA